MSLIWFSKYYIHLAGKEKGQSKLTAEIELITWNIRLYIYQVYVSLKYLSQHEKLYTHCDI